MPVINPLLFIDEPIAGATANRVLFAGTGPALADSGNLLFDPTGAPGGLGAFAMNTALAGASGTTAIFYGEVNNTSGTAAALEVDGLANPASAAGQQVAYLSEMSMPTTGALYFVEATKATVLHDGTTTVANVIGFDVTYFSTGSGDVTQIYGGSIYHGYYGTSDSSYISFFETYGDYAGAGSFTHDNVVGHDLFPVDSLTAGQTIVNLYGLIIVGPGGTGGTIGSCKGLKIGSMKNAAITHSTTPYGISQEGANDLNYFAGFTGIGISTPGTVLDVEGLIAQDLGINLNQTIRSGSGVLVPDHYEIPDGFSLELADTAIFTIV